VSTTHHATSGTNNSTFGSERDGARETSHFINAGLRPDENLEIRAFLRQLTTYAEGDPQDFTFGGPNEGLIIDGNEESDTDQLYGNIQADWLALSGALQTRLGYAFASTERHNYADSSPSFFTEADRQKLSLVSALKFETQAVKHTLTAAVDGKRETYRNLPIGIPTGVNDRRTLETLGLVASYDVSVGDFDAGIALRRDLSDAFQDANTYRLQASYRMNETRLRASAGSGIKNPTNFELFGFDPLSFIGNPALTPEKSVGWDVGIDHYFLDGNARLGVTYFEATLEDEIFTAFLPGFLSTPANRTSKSDRNGIELSLDASLDDWDLAAQYTYTNATDNGVEEVRRPPHTASINITRKFLERASATLTVRYNGEQTDNEFSSSTPEDFVTLSAFTLVNVSASYELADNIQLFARAENLLNEKYEEVYSFQSPGISATAGMKVKF
jgi:vitamin B12 transporter